MGIWHGVRTSNVIESQRLEYTKSIFIISRYPQIHDANITDPAKAIKQAPAKLNLVYSPLMAAFATYGYHPSSSMFS
jgi:hypothetical protein